MKYTKYLIIVALVTICVGCRNKQKEFYIQLFKNNKTDFIYFSRLRSEIFNKNIGCLQYTVQYNIRGDFAMYCNDFDINRSKEFTNDFLDSAGKINMKKFMIKIDLDAVIYYRDSVCFVFRGEPIITITNSERSVQGDFLEPNFYLRYAK